MTKKSFYLYNNINNTDYLVCEITYDEENYLSFQYSSEWINLPFAYPFHKTLPLSNKTFVAENNTELFPFLLDILPDNIGCKILYLYNNTLQVCRFSHIKNILSINDFIRQGSYRFKTNIEKDFETKNSIEIPNLSKLKDTIQNYEYFLSNDFDNVNINKLHACASSLSGRIPKFNVFDNQNNLCIAKFSKDKTLVVSEALSLELAKLCGLNVQEFSLMKLDEYYILIVKRFDRQGKIRIPFQTLLTVTNSIYSEDINYEKTANELKYLCQNNTEILVEFYKRIVFSHLIQNNDDNLRNHGLLFKQNYWKLAPLYDINILGGIIHKTLHFNENFKDLIYIDNVIKFAPFFNISKKQAIKIIKDMQEKLSEWNVLAQKIGLDDEYIKYIKPYLEFNITKNLYF